MSKSPQKSVLCLILLIITAVFYFSHEGGGLEPLIEDADKSEVVESTSVDSIASDVVEQSVQGSEFAEAALPIRNAPIVEEVSSKLRRGINNRLLLPEAVVSERSQDPSLVSSEIIFSPTNQGITGPLTIDNHTLSAIEASVDVAALESFLASSDGAIRIPVAENKDVLARFDRVVTRGPHTKTLIGSVVDDSYSDILIVIHDGAVSGTVAFHDTNTQYQFAAAGNGDVAIRHLDPHSFGGGCGHPEHEVANKDRFDQSEYYGEVLEAPAGAQLFDMVVGYSAEAKQSDGGTANIEARIIGAVDQLNDALSNSQSDDWFCSLLAMIEEPNSTFSDADYEGMGGILTDLNQTTDGVLDTITDLKVELGADQATFICDGAISGTAGIANRPGPHCVVARTYTNTSNLTFAHEIGHNLGLRHGWGDSGNTGTNPKDQSNYGWRFRTSGGSKVRTIMAYSAGWNGSRIPYFSNPNVNYNGAPTGVPRGFDATDTSATPAYDQLFVLDGSIGGLGAGFDGTNSDLGARSGDYLVYNTGTMANRDAREALAVLEPIVGTNFLPGDSTTIYWHGGDHTDSVQIDLHKDGAFQSTIASGLTGDARWYDWTVPNIPGGANFTVRVILSGATSDDSGTFTIGTPVVTVPYSEGFEDGLGAWIQSPDDDYDWTLNTGGTDTDATGPDGASSGSWYLYAEPNDVYEGHYKTTQIDCVVNMSNVSSAELSFDYHIYGTNVDYLAVDVHDGTTWANDVFKLLGEHQFATSDPWLNAVVDLSAYAGNSAVTVRFRAKQKYWHKSDISIDNIIIDGPQTIPFSENFEGGLVGLRQSADDDLDWTWNTGGTPTGIADNNTGPEGASDGSYYIYVENHDSGVQYKIASLEGTFDLSAVSDAELTFDYHMYGFYIDYLAVYVYDGSDWVEVWIRSGQQQSSQSDPWSNAVVDLSVYTGNDSVRILVSSKQKQWHAADTAIDNLQLTGTPLTPYEEWSLNAFSDAPAGADTSATGNPDVDSLNNELEWFLGTDPLASNSVYNEMLIDPSSMSFGYTRRKLVGYDIYAQWSPDLSLGSWFTDDLNEAVDDDNGEVETISVTIPIDGAEDKKFVRIKVDEL